MSEKAKLTKVQVEAYEAARKHIAWRQDDAFLNTHGKVLAGAGKWIAPFEVLNEIDYATMARVVLKGYTAMPEPITITITPEQIKRIRRNYGGDSFSAWDSGIKFVFVDILEAPEVLEE